MTRNIDRPISRQALGRTAYIGYLYDATTDEFCERPVVNEAIPEAAIRYMDENHGHSSYEFDSAISKKLRKFNVDASLSVSILGGLIKNAGTTFNYMHTKNKTSYQLEAIFAHRTVTRTESLNVSHKEFKSRIEPTALGHKYATHVVTSIKWGADIFAQFEAETETEESKDEVKAGLKLELNKLLSKFITINPNNSIAVPVDIAKAPATVATTTTTGSTGSTAASVATIESGTTAPQISFDSSSTKTAFSCKITLFGDIVPTSCPKSMEELIAILPSIASGVRKENGGKGRPLEYSMLPLTELADILGQELASRRIFRAVEENVAYTIQSVFDRWDELHTIVHTLFHSVKKAEKFFLKTEIGEILRYKNELNHATRMASDRIGKMVVQVRGGSLEPSELDQLLVEIDRQIIDHETRIEQLRMGDISNKIQYTQQLHEKGVISIRDHERRAAIQHRNPKKTLVILYTSNELRTSSPDEWTSVYYDFLGLIEKAQATNSQFVFCYFDYDLRPNFKTTQKRLEVQKYVSPHKDRQAQLAKQMSTDSSQYNGLHSLITPIGTATHQPVDRWHLDVKIKLENEFAYSNSPQILSPYRPSSCAILETQKNILFIGQPSVGKSTLKNILANPTWTPDVGRGTPTMFPQFERYGISKSNVILNFIDTPGICQQTDSSSVAPDTQTIMQFIDTYIRSKVSQLHFVCFCIPLENKINPHSLDAVEAFLNSFGMEFRKNACLIITRSESKSEEQLKTSLDELQTDLKFKSVSSQMSQGIFFSGSIHPDDWTKKSNSVHQQFKHVCEFRQKLLKHLIDTDVKPIVLTTPTPTRK